MPPRRRASSGTDRAPPDLAAGHPRGARAQPAAFDDAGAVDDDDPFLPPRTYVQESNTSADAIATASEHIEELHRDADANTNTNTNAANDTTLNASENAHISNTSPILDHDHDPRRHAGANHELEHHEEQQHQPRDARAPPRSDTSHGERSYDYEDRYDTYGYRRTPELGSSPVGSYLPAPTHAGPSRAQLYMEQYHQDKHQQPIQYCYETPPRHQQQQQLHAQPYQHHASHSHKRRPQSLYAASPHRDRDRPKTRRPASVLSTRTVPQPRHNDHGQWHVRASGPTIGVEDTQSRARLDRRETGEAEVELSSFCAPDMPSSTGNNKRSTWSGSLINGAVSAAVFSAAVGLTAYRFWKGWGSGDNDDDEHADDDGDAYFKRPDPPEIYEPESLGPESVPQGQMQTPPRRPPSQASSSLRSPPSTRRRTPRKRAQRPSIAELMVATARAQGKQPSSPSTSVSTSVYVPTATVSEVSKSPLTDYRPLPEDVAEESEDDEMNTRLDEMARRLQNLIAEGNRALESKASPPPSSAAIETPLLDRSEWRFMRELDYDDDKPSPRSESSFPTFTTAPTAPLSASDSLSRRHSERNPTGADSVSRRTAQSSLSRAQSVSSIPRPRAVKQDATNSPSPQPFPSSPATSPSASSSSTLPSVAIPGSKGAPPRDRTGSWTRGLPPLPWRRDPSGESRWVQRPLSPQPPERSNTPIPPVPPVPPEHASSRPPSMIYLQKRNSTKRYSAPPLKLAARHSSPASPITRGDATPAEPASPHSRPGSSASTAPDRERTAPPSPLSQRAPRNSAVVGSPISSSVPNSLSSRIPRHVRSGSLATNFTNLASPPPSPTPPVRSRPLTSASVASTQSSVSAASVPSSLSESSGSGASGAPSGVTRSILLPNPKAATSPSPARRQQSLEWRDTPLSSTSLRFATRVAQGGRDFEPPASPTPSSSSPVSRRSELPYVAPITPGIVAARTAAITGASPDRVSLHPSPRSRSQSQSQSQSPSPYLSRSQSQSQSQSQAPAQSLSRSRSQSTSSPSPFQRRPSTPQTPAAPSAAAQSQAQSQTPQHSSARPQTPGSAGSGRSRIPVRRSIDPDSFAAFGRIE